MRSLLRLPTFVCPLLLGCTATISGEDGGLPPNSSDKGPGGAVAGGSGPGGSDPSACTASTPPADGTRIPRLSHLQYDGAVSALLKLDLHPAAEFAPDPPNGGFDNNADALKVVDRAGRDYRKAAEESAAALVKDSAALAAVAPCATPDSQACGPSFVASFGELAFRRPLEEDEKTRYLALYAQGNTLLETGSTHARGVQLVVEAMLQSPNFLYRVEVDEKADASGGARRSGYELATRLAFALWNAPPDAELRQAAATGLSTAQQVATQAERLLLDERARPVLEDFHRQWLGTDAYSNITRDEAQFPAFVSGIGAALREESRRFVSSVTFDRGLGLQALLNDTTAFVDQDLAKLYGLTGNFGTGMTEVQLDPSQRAGLLTRVGFLAQNAHATSSAPILRGAQILKRFMCYEFPPPPAGASNTPLPPFSDTIRTGRDQVTKLTESPTCAACHHATINPMGFAFEGFDAVGQARDADRGFPLDLKGSFSLGSTQLTFDGAIEASKQIAESKEARACYAANWLRYFFARLDTPADACTIEELARRMADPAYGVKALLTDLSGSSSFQYRSPEVP